MYHLLAIIGDTSRRHSLPLNLKLNSNLGYIVLGGVHHLMLGASVSGNDLPGIWCGLYFAGEYLERG